MQVLLLRVGALGDILLLLPAIAALRAAGHDVSLAAPLPTASVLRGPGAASAVFDTTGPELAAALADGFSEGPLTRALAGADAVVAYSRSEPLLERLRERARRLVVHDPQPPAHGTHASAWLASAVATLLGSSDDGRQALPPGGVLEFTAAEQREARARASGLGPGFVAVHPGSGSPAKCWPLPRFLEAARLLAGEARWLLVSGPAEQGLEAPAGALLAREWPPRVLGAALARAGVYLGNDSGVSHLAGATGAKTLALFGPTDPLVWAPVGPRVATICAPRGALSDLAVERVVDAASRLRSAASGPPAG